MPRIRVSEINGVALLLFTLSLLAGIAIAQATRQEAYGIAGAIVGLYFLFAIKIVRQWEKVAVLRLGRYVGLRGPGLCLIVPIVETLSPYVDQRVRVASVSAESTLTRDTVPVNVDAIVFWMVWNAVLLIAFVAWLVANGPTLGGLLVFPLLWLAMTWLLWRGSRRLRART